MELHSGEGMGRGPGLVCRQSRPRGILAGLVMCAILAGMLAIVRYAGAPRWVLVAGSVPAALIAALFLRDALVRFRPTNWVLQVGPDGLWINLRPLQSLPADGAAAATALHLGYAEIARVHRHIDRWSTPSSSGGSTLWKQEFLELRVASGDTRRLAPAVAEARAADRNAPVSVTLPAPGVIRVAWRGPGHDVAPGLRRVLAEMGPRVAVADPTRTDRPDWSRLSDAELDELVEHLVRCGDRMGASALLIGRRGCSATEAHMLVEALSARA